MSHIGARRAI